VKTVTKYEATDGAQFDNMQDCIAHEDLCKEIDSIMSTLPVRPNNPHNCDFENGHGYVQHKAEVFYDVREKLLNIANRIYKHKWFDQSIKDKSVHPGWAGRIIGETSRPLSKAWYRIMCTDKKFREWGQPYYADNPEQASSQQEIKV